MQIRRLSSAEADFQKKFSELVAVDASVDPEITRSPLTQAVLKSCGLRAAGLKWRGNWLTMAS